jgi:predicted transcriptional regulator
LNPAIESHLPPLSPAARRILDELYEHQPATRDQLAKRTGLRAGDLDRGFAHLRTAGLLRGQTELRDGRPGFVWLDLVPALRPAWEVAA